MWRAYGQLTPSREADDAQLKDNQNASALPLRVTKVYGQCLIDINGRLDSLDGQSYAAIMWVAMSR
jgi:hypothetical protein